MKRRTEDATEMQAKPNSPNNSPVYTTALSSTAQTITAPTARAVDKVFDHEDLMPLLVYTLSLDACCAFDMVCKTSQAAVRATRPDAPRELAQQRKTYIDRFCEDGPMDNELCRPNNHEDEYFKALDSVGVFWPHAIIEWQAVPSRFMAARYNALLWAMSGYDPHCLPSPPPTRPTPAPAPPACSTPP